MKALDGPKMDTLKPLDASRTSSPHMQHWRTGGLAEVELTDNRVANCPTKGSLMASPRKVLRNDVSIVGAVQSGRTTDREGSGMRQAGCGVSRRTQWQEASKDGLVFTAASVCIWTWTASDLDGI